MANLKERIREGRFDPNEDAGLPRVRGGGADKPSSLREQIQGGQFEPQILSGDDTMGEPGLDAPMTRFRMGQGGNFKEKLEAFKRRFPEGDLVARELDGQNTLLFRPDQKTPFAKVDAGITERFEPVGDIVDFLGEDGGAIVGEIVAAGATRGTSLIGLMGRLFAGGTVGDLSQEAIQKIRGEQEESFDKVVGDAATKGAFGAVTGAGSEILVRNAINLFRGAGLTGTQEGSSRVVRSARRLGVDEPPLDTLADSPVVRGAGTLSRASAPTIPRYVANIRQSTRRVEQTLRSVGNKAKAAGNIENAVNNARERFLREANQNLGGRKKVVNFAKAIQTYDDLSQARINALYKRARSVSEPQFDLSGVKNEAARVLRSFKAQNIELDRDLEKALTNLIKFRNKPKVFKLPDGSMEEISVTDQLGGIQEQLFDAANKSVDPVTSRPVSSRSQKLAGRIRSMVGEAMDNAEGGDPKFNELWSKARAAARDRFESLEKGIVLRARKTEEPEQFAARLIDNPELQNIQFLKRAGVKVDDLRGVFVDRSLRKPRQTVEQMDEMRPEFRRQFISEADEGVIRNYADQIERLDSLGLERIRARESETSQFIGQILDQGTRQMDTLRQLVDDNGGLDSEVGRSIRAAIVDRVVRNSVFREGGTVRINKSALQGELKALREAGGFKLLTKSDAKTLLNVKDIEEVVASAEDFGGSLARQEMISGLRSGASGDTGALKRAAITLAEQLGMGRMLTSDFGRRVLVGSGNRKISRSGAMAAAAAVAQQAFTSEPVEETERKMNNIMGAM